MTIEKDKSRVLGGLRATLENPLTSDDAKEKARARLADLENDEESGDKIVEPGQKMLRRGAPGEGLTLSAEDQHENRSIGALKATLANDRTSEEAKAKAIAEIEQRGSKADIEHALRDVGQSKPEEG